MKSLKKAFAFLVLLIFLSGCVSSAEPTSTEGLEVKKYDNEQRILHSYQFWNEYPLSVGNTTVFNESGLLGCEIKTFNHEEGNLTLHIHYDDETILNKSFRNQTAYFTISVSANMTLDSYSMGYHDPEVAPIGDYFVIDCSLKY